MQLIHKLLDKYRSLSRGVKATFWFLVCSFLQKGISAITTPIFTRLLTTAEYGQYSIFTSWLNVAKAVVTLNICYGFYSQGVVKFSEDRDVFASSLQGLGLTLTTIWTAVYLIFRETFNSWLQLTTVQVLYMLILVWLSTVFTFWSTMQRVDLNYRALVTVTLAVSLAQSVVSVLLVIFSDDKVTARIFGMVLIELIGYGWIFFYQMARGKRFFSAKYWKYAIGFCLPLLPHYLSQVLLSSCDRIMIGWLVDDSSAGIYGLAYSVSQIMSLFNSAFNNAIEPWLYKQMKNRQIDRIKSVAYPSMILIGGVNLLLIAVAPEVIAIFAPEEYYEAIWVIPPLAMSVFFTFCYTLFATFEFYYEKQGRILIASFSGGILNVVLNFLLIPTYGYLVAGYTTLVSYAVYAILHYVFMHGICKEKFDGEQPYSTWTILLISVVFIALGLSFLPTYNHPLVRYLYIAVLLVIVFINRRKLVEHLKMIMGLKKEPQEGE